MTLRILPFEESHSAMRTIEIQSHEPLGIILLETAKHIFKECRAENDFCVQSLTEDEEIASIIETGSAEYPIQVFGSCNRLLWHPVQGWYISESHCTPDFIESFHRLMKRGRFE